MLDQVAKLRADAAEAIASAADAAALEDLRVRLLGRKSQLTGILRGIGELDPAQRGPVGAAANEARQAIDEALARRRGELEGAGLERPAPGRRDRRHPARDPAGRRRAPAPDHPHPPRDRGRLRRDGLPGAGGARDRARLLQLHRAESPARPPGADGAGHVLRGPGDPARGRRQRARPAARPAGRRAAHAHLADADPGHGGPGAADLRDRARDRVPARFRRHAHADVLAGGGPGRRAGHLALPTWPEPWRRRRGRCSARNGARG